MPSSADLERKAPAYQNSLPSEAEQALLALPQIEGSKFKTFIVGNAPVVTGLEKYKAQSGSTAIIALSGMRALLLACQLGNRDYIPKIILIDNSKLVIQFWQVMRAFAQQHSDEASFCKNLPTFLNQHQSLYKHLEKIEDVKGVKYPNQNILRFFQNIFKEYGYDYARRVMMNASTIQQSWAHRETFENLKTILAKVENIYTFPSDLVAYVNLFSACPKKEMYQILENIRLINPKLSIHADISPQTKKPTKIFLIEDQNPDDVLKHIFANSFPVGLRDEKKLSPEDEAKFILQNIKFRIHSTPWTTQGMFGVKKIGAKPSYVKLQLQILEQAETKKITAERALQLVKVKAKDAREHPNSRRDKQFTEPYYDLFSPDQEDKFNSKFRF